LRVEVFACNGGLEAKLAIRDFEASRWKADFGEKSKLVRHLCSQGLIPELVDQSALESICGLLGEVDGDWTAADYTLKEAQSTPVSCGLPPADEEAEGLMFHKGYLSDADTVKAFRAKLSEEGFDQAKASVDAECLVEPGQSILSFLGIRPGKQGKDVFGKSIPFRSYEQALPEAGRGIRKLENMWVAEEAGVLMLEGNALKIIGPDNLKDVQIKVSDDRMSAHLRIRSGVVDEHEVDRKLKAINSMMVEMGLKAAASFDRIIDALHAGEECDLLLLEGIPSKPGKDGCLRLLVNPEPDLPDPDLVAKLDFKEFTFFRSIKKGEQLAKVQPPDPGIPGRDVFGVPVPAVPGGPFRKEPGANTEYSPADKSIIVASCNGRLSLEDGIPSVVDTLKVEDVSFKTGNVSFPGSVEVGGNVLDSFVIDAKGDVGIGGVVENAQVVSEGSIVIKGGVVGGSKGLIKSKLSSVTIGYIRNQRIESHSNIVVYNEVFNAQLLACKSILMKSSSHSVVGGYLTAFDCIEVYNSGNGAGAKTFLEVGKDFEVEAVLNRKKEQLKVVRADLEFLGAKLEKIQLIVRWKASGKPEIRLLEQRVKGVMEFLEKVKPALSAEMEALEKKLYNPQDSYIYVRGTVYPGTVLKFRDRVIPITEEMRDKRWIFKAKG
jgi:uncharacterized protein (DUF342 family)